MIINIAIVDNIFIVLKKHELFLNEIILTLRDWQVENIIPNLCMFMIKKHTLYIS